MTLSRLKPSPLPAVRPVPEYLADPALRAIYDDTKATLQVPWMGVVTMAFAHYRTFYAALWEGVRELAGSQEFVASCLALRREAEAAVLEIGIADLGGPLSAIGYAPGEIEEIRDLIEVFSHGNMPYLLIATLARLLLEGEPHSLEKSVHPFLGRHGPATVGRLTLMEAHHGDASTVAVYADIRATLGLPFVNTDYRALARWPSYLQRAWAGLRPNVGTVQYERAVTRTHVRAVEEICRLPNPGRLTPEGLQSAALRDAPLEEVRDVVRLFQWLLPGLIVNVAFLRTQLTSPVKL